jgi:hypothetical protein
MRSPILTISISVLTTAAFAQSDKGTLAGTVLDPFGEPAAEASVQLINPRSGANFKTTTGKDGRYTLSDLPAGSWDVTVSLPAVQDVSQKDVAIAAAKTTTLDLHLIVSSQLSTRGEDTQHFLADQKLHRGRRCQRAVAILLEVERRFDRGCIRSWRWSPAIRPRGQHSVSRNRGIRTADSCRIMGARFFNL